MNKPEFHMSLERPHSSTLSRSDNRAALVARGLNDLLSSREAQGKLIAGACIGRKWGFIDASGDFAISPQFDKVHGFSDGLAAVRLHQRWGWIDWAGNLTIPCRYKKVSAFRDGTAVVTYPGKPGLRGLLDKTGRFIDLSRFDSVYPLVQGLAIVRIDEREGLVKSDGSVVIEPREGDFDDFSGGFARFCQVIPPNECVTFGYIDPNGREVVPPILEDAGPFAEELACATREIVNLDDMHWGCINGQGEFVIPEQFPQIWSLGKFDLGVLAVMVKRKWGYVDRTGNYVVEPRFANWGVFRGGLAAVKDTNGLYGFINLGGSFVIAPRFEEASQFSEGVAAVKISGKWGYISPNGEFQIPPQFDRAEEFSDGIAKVWTQLNERGFVTATGKVIVSDEDSPIYPARFQHGFIGVGKGGKYGFLNRNGELAIPFKFDQICSADGK